MDFFIKKYSVSKPLKLEILKVGRDDYNQIMSNLDNLSVKFSMKNADNGRYVILNDDAVIEGNYIYYYFSKKHTKNIGTYIGEFNVTFINETFNVSDSTITLPINEELYINVIDSISNDKLCCKQDGNFEFINLTETARLTPTPTPTSTQTPTPTQTPTVTPTKTQKPTVTPTKTQTPTPSTSIGASPQQTPTPTKTPSITQTITPTSSSILNGGSSECISYTYTASPPVNNQITYINCENREDVFTLQPGGSLSFCAINGSVSVFGGGSLINNGPCEPTPTVTPNITPTVTPNITPTYCETFNISYEMSEGNPFTPSKIYFSPDGSIGNSNLSIVNANYLIISVFDVNGVDKTDILTGVTNGTEFTIRSINNPSESVDLIVNNGNYSQINPRVTYQITSLVSYTSEPQFIVNDPVELVINDCLYPTPTPTQSEGAIIYSKGYLLIEPDSQNEFVSNYLSNNGATYPDFRGFGYLTSPQTTLSIQLYMGLFSSQVNNNLLIYELDIPQNTQFGSYLFETITIPIGTVNESAWYTFFIPDESMGGNTLTSVKYGISEQTLNTNISTEPTMYNFGPVQYNDDGTFITGNYRIYTTWPSPGLRLSDINNDVVFRGGGL